MSPTELTKVRDVLARALSVEAVNQLGRDTGQAVRLRTVTPHRLFLAVVSALASGHVASLADLLRAFNYHNGVHVAYKAFYNRLARVGFTLFMRGMCARLIERLRLQTLTPAGHTAVARFTDIVIHDGSSFAVKPTLRGTFPGRFTTLGPAAVEVHATYSGCADEIRAVQIAPDREAERPFLPDPATLTGCLLLADRGYPSVPYFEAVQAHGGAFLVRLTRNYDPWVRTAWVDGRRSTVPPGIRLSRFLATRATRTVDLDVEFDRGDHRVGFRVVAVPGRDPTMTRLCTNLPRTPFSPARACPGRGRRRIVHNGRRVCVALEHMAVPHDEVFPAPSIAERPFDPQKDAVRSAEAEANAVVRLQVTQVEIAGAGGHVPGIVKDCTVHGRKDLPPVLGLEQEQAVVAEAESIETPQILWPA